MKKKNQIYLVNQKSQSEIGEPKEKKSEIHFVNKKSQIYLVKEKSQSEIGEYKNIQKTRKANSIGE